MTFQVVFDVLKRRIYARNLLNYWSRKKIAGLHELKKQLDKFVCWETRRHKVKQNDFS